MAAVKRQRGFWHYLLVYWGVRDCCDKPDIVVRRIGSVFCEDKCLRCHYARPSTPPTWWW